MFLFFFFQAEDGIRDKLVTGVQTCALPIFTAESAQVGGRACPPSGVGSACEEKCLRRYLSPTVGRSRCGLSAPARNWAFARSPSIAKRTGIHCPYVLPTKRSVSGRRNSRKVI